MDNRLVLTVLFVTLSWMSMTTYASNTTTPMPSSNMTSDNMTSPMPPTNMTSPMPPTNMTSPMPSDNMTSPMAQNVTTVVPVTETPSVIPNITVATLVTAITRAQCGTEELCAAEPATCDPSQSSTCFFLSAKAQSGNTFLFGLSGQTEGYVSATVSNDDTVGNGDTTYVCANDNNKVKFFITTLSNNVLTMTEGNVSDVKGRVNGNVVQCTFAADVVPGQTRNTGAALGIATGSFNSTTGALGSPTLKLSTNVVDLANPNATVTNTLSNTTANTTTATPTTTPTGHGVTFQQSLMQALLISFGILGLTLV